MRIQTNIAALNSQRQLGINEKGQAKATEKLSSGYRINRAADDAAGLSISEKMRSQIRGLNQASSNAQDAVSLIQAAEGAMTEIHSVLQRMRELGNKAASDVLENEDRQAVQSEIDQLVNEVDRIAFSTEFNKKTVLDGSISDGVLVARVMSGSGVAPGVVATALVDPSDDTSDSNIGFHSIAVDPAGTYTATTMTYDFTGAVEGDMFTVNLELDDATAGLSGGQVVGESGQADVFNYKATGNADVDNAAFVNGLKAALDGVFNDYTVTNEGNTLRITANGVGALFGGASLQVVEGDNNAGTIPDETLDLAEPVEGVDAVITIDGDETISTDEQDKFVRATSTFRTETGHFKFSMNDLTKTSSTLLEVKAGKALTVQVGANSGSDQAIVVDIPGVSSTRLGIDNLRVLTHDSAQAAMDAIEMAITSVSKQRSDMGAVQNRLDHSIANLNTVSENLTSSEARIRDVDMAQEMMGFTKYNILNQAGTAMLSQANQIPQGVLQLLR